MKQMQLDEYSSVSSSSGVDRRDNQCPPQVAEPTERHKQQLVEQAQAHARTVDLDIDVEAIRWDVSTNSQRTRRAGDCRYEPQTDQLTITLTWAAYVAWGWEKFSATIRHELIHAYQFSKTGQSGHGWAFKRLAQQVDTHVHCQRFATGRLLVYCDNGCEDHRNKASKLIKYPGNARCRAHDASFTIEHVETERTWTDHDGYERQRAAIERSDTGW